MSRKPNAPQPAAAEEARRLLTVAGLAKAYQGRRVVDGVSIHVDAGEIVGLLGPNGAGKTTSFNMAVGLVRPDEGKVTFGDQDITGLAMHQRARLGIGYLTQEPSVFRKLTVEQNILAILETCEGDRTERAVRLNYLLDELDLASLAKSRAYQLSGGEKRRLEITRALVTSPKMLLLDEPFGMLDSLTRFELQQVLIDLWSADQKTALMVTHDVDEALFLSDRVVMMTNGPSATVGDILTVPFPHPRNRAVMMEHPDYDALRGDLVGFLERQGHKPDDQYDAAGSPPASSAKTSSERVASPLPTAVSKSASIPSLAVAALMP